LGSQAAALGRNAAIFDSVSDKLGRIGDIFQGFYLGIAERVGGQLLEILDRVEKVDLVGAGEKFGDGIAKGINLLAGVFTDPAAIFGVSIQYFGESFMAIWRATPAVLQKIVDGFTYSLVGASQKFGAEMLREAGNFAGELLGAMTFAGENGVDRLATKLRDAAVGFGKFMLDALTPKAAKIANMMASSVAGALGDAAGKTLGEYMAEGKSKTLDLGASLDEKGNANLAKGRGSFGEAAAIAGKAIISPTLHIKDYLGGNAGGPATAGPAIEAAAKKTRWGRMNGNAWDPVTRAIEARTRNNWAANHNFGTTMLDENPMATGRPWTGATEAFSNGTSAAPFRNGTGLSTGGLGGGAYGRTGNIWSQISGASKKSDDPTIAHLGKILTATERTNQIMESTWGSGSSGARKAGAERRRPNDGEGIPPHHGPPDPLRLSMTLPKGGKRAGGHPGAFGGVPLVRANSLPGIKWRTFSRLTSYITSRLTCLTFPPSASARYTAFQVD
jgi:hypothetical protein